MVPPIHRAIRDIEAGVEEQRQKFGKDSYPHPLLEWMFIWGEEVHEVYDASNAVHWRDGNISDLRTELVHVAAVCAAFITHIDNGGP